MKTKILQKIEVLETKFDAAVKEYTSYPEGKYDADYYLLVGQAQAYGEAADLLKELIKI